MFDGNGHTVELNLQYGGLFGKLGAGAVVKNIAFIVKKINNTRLMNSATVIAQRTTGSATIKDVYVKYDLGDYELDTSFNGSVYGIGMGLFDDQPYDSTLSNIVIDYSSVKTSVTGTDAFRYGTLYSRPNTSSTADWGKTTVSNIYIIASETFFSMSHEYDPYNGYVTLPTYTQIHFAGNDTEAYEQFKAEDPDATVFKFDFVKRYDSFEAFAQDKENNDYSSFDTELWDTSNGYPVWKQLSIESEQ